MIASVLLLSACGDLFSDDVDDTSDDGLSGTTPVATEGDIPTSDPTETVRAESTVTEDGEWTVITGPERQDPPGPRGEDQVLRLNGSTDGPSTIDPALVRDTETTFFARQVFRGLIRLNSDLEPVPDLAERVEISEDRLTYRFYLHDNITFHDGTPIDAQRVKASLERATDPALVHGDGRSLPSRNYLDDIEGALARMDGERDDIPGIQVIDERTLQIDLVRGVVHFMENLANATTYVVDVDDAASGDDWWRSPNGSGPFVVAEWDSDRVIRLTPHDGYVRPPRLREVTIRVGREAVGEIRLYESGEIDLAAVAVSVVDRFDYQGGPHEGELRVEPMLSTTFVLMNPTIEPFDDERVRQAMLHGFPRGQIAAVMFDGRVQPADGILPPEMDAPGGTVLPYEYDEERAGRLLSSADVELPHGMLTIYTSGGAIPAAMKHYYDQIFGAELEVVQLRWSDYIQDLQDRRLPFFVLSWVSDGPDPVSFLRSLFHSSSPENYSGFSDSEVDELLDEAIVEPDEDRRAELVREAEQRILDSAVVMPLYHSVDHQLVAEHVRGLETSPMGILGLESAWIER